jgi:hypothetical protein
VLDRTTSTNLPRQHACEKNPKSEYRKRPRGPKQTPRQINLKSRKSKTPNPKEACLEFYPFWSFEIVSIRGAAFGFGASNFFVLGALCAIARVTEFPASFSGTKLSNMFG